MSARGAKPETLAALLAAGWELPIPFVIGCDVAGVVESIGAGVEGIAVGDEVVLNPGLWCGRCPNCLAGEQSMCPRYELLGEHLDGTFAEAIVVPAVNCYPKPGRLSWEQAGSFALATLTANTETAYVGWTELAVAARPFSAKTRRSPTRWETTSTTRKNSTR